MSKWLTLYLSQNAVKLSCNKKAKGKDVVGDDALRLILNNLAGHANETDGLKVWVSPETQAEELKKDMRQVRRGRKQLQEQGLMIETGEKKGQAKVWELKIPGFNEWVEDFLHLDTASTTGASTTGANGGAKTGANRGANRGALVSASAPQTELNETDLSTSTLQSEQVLFENVIKAELKIIPTQAPIEKLKKIKQNYLPTIRQVLERFPGQENNRDAVIYALSKIFAHDPRFMCTPSTFMDLKKHEAF